LGYIGWVEVVMIHSEHWVNDFDFYGWQDELEINGSIEKYYQMVLWINENIKNPKNNVVWTYAYNPIFRFRKSKDQVWFLLRWS
jgi:hypothetical protein